MRTGRREGPAPRGVAPGWKQAPLVLMRNYEPLSKIPWRDGWNASRFSLLPETSSLIPELQNACVFAPTTRTCRCGSPRTTRQQATAGCRPAGASGRVLSVGLRWSRRRGEIQQAMAMHRACGGEVHLLTLTVPHTRFDVLETLLERQGKTLKASCVTERSRRYSRKWATSARFAAMRRPTGARAQTTAGTRTSISSSSSWSRGCCAAYGLENPPLSAVGCLLPKGRPWLALLPAWPRPA